MPNRAGSSPPSPEFERAPTAFAPAASASCASGEIAPSEIAAVENRATIAAGRLDLIHRDRLGGRRELEQVAR